MGQCMSQNNKSDFDRHPENKLPKRVSQRTSLLNGRRASRLSSINLSLVDETFKDVSDDKFQLKEAKFNGTFKTEHMGKKEQRYGKSIEHGIRKFKAHPKLYYAMFYPDEMKDWPENEQQYVYLYRAGLVGFEANGVSSKGNTTLLTLEYHPLKKLKNDLLPKKQCDEYTDTVLAKYGGKKLHSTKNKPLLPGRGMGCCDAPELKLMGDIDPSSIRQGQVGDCWLLSGISALAEYDGAIKRLFRKTKGLGKLPKDSPNRYTVTLYDLKTWKEVDIVVDERLCARSDRSGRTVGCKPTEESDLWVCYLEKAIAAHCGGWDKIDGGHCTHAWSLMTGVKEQYIITKKAGTKKWVCGAKYNTQKKEWVEHSNSPTHGLDQGMFVVPWPKVGKSGDGKATPLSEKQLFKMLCQWDDENYLIGAASKGESDKNTTNGIVDNHSYSVVDCRNNVAGTGIDLIMVRNPWGYGQIEKGKFGKNGSGWKKYPQIKDEIKPIFSDVDDGIFWMSRYEFFKHYDSIYLGASNLKFFINN